MDFGVLSPGESRTRIVAIRPRACTNFVVQSARVQSARSTHRGFNLSLDGPAGSGANNCWELTVRCEAPATPGRQAMSGLAILETSSLRVPRLQVPLLAQVWPEEGVMPRVLVLPERGASGESRLTVETRRPARVLRLYVDRSAGLEELRAGAWSRDTPDWGREHVCRVSNEALAGARAIIFELTVRDAADRTEARLARVPISRLPNLE